ncbi:UNVERIFIED_ORG: hypothetical protein QE446_003105 [Rhizobium sp. SORGH_AS260]|nr:hypothetical protein [Rhizobium sp. SORGH_AS_0260]
MTNNLNMATRTAPRSKTRIFATVHYFSQSTRGRVVDLSATGMALELDGPFAAAKGSRVKVQSEDLGFIEGVVQWQHMNRLGLQLKLFHQHAGAALFLFPFLPRRRETDTGPLIRSITMRGTNDAHFPVRRDLRRTSLTKNLSNG